MGGGGQSSPERYKTRVVMAFWRKIKADVDDDVDFLFYSHSHDRLCPVSGFNERLKIHVIDGNSADTFGQMPLVSLCV